MNKNAGLKLNILIKNKKNDNQKLFLSLNKKKKHGYLIVSATMQQISE